MGSSTSRPIHHERRPVNPTFDDSPGIPDLLPPTYRTVGHRRNHNAYLRQPAALRKLLPWHVSDNTELILYSSPEARRARQNHERNSWDGSRQPQSRRDDVDGSRHRADGRSGVSETRRANRKRRRVDYDAPIISQDTSVSPKDEQDAHMANEKAVAYAREVIALQEESARLALMVCREALAETQSEILAIILARQEELAAGHSRKAKALTKRLSAAEARAEHDAERIRQMTAAAAQRMTSLKAQEWAVQQRYRPVVSTDRPLMILPAATKTRPTSDVQEIQPDTHEAPGPSDLAVGAARAAARAAWAERKSQAVVTVEHHNRTQCKPSVRECAACLECHLKSEMVMLVCEHWYCRTSLTTAIEAAYASRRLFKCCRTLTSAPSYIASPLAANYNMLAQELTSIDPLYCSRRKCSVFLPIASRSGGDKDPGPDNIICPRCSRSTCRHCRAQKHPKSICANDVGIQQVKKLGETRGWKACPRCHHMVEKDFGCVHMTCRCGANFCYRCGGYWRKCRGAKCTFADLSTT